MSATGPENGDCGGKHVPVRMCVICRGRFPKAGLSRYVDRSRASGGPATAETAPPHLVHDAKMRMDGRGHYVCDNPVCREKFKKFAGRGRKR
ncbi:DUF448 domain-containing protein [Desulfovibrio sulfodismutans]|uniref:DUF448 domain-containing protein n=2 Tax=Desulfolutivibrio sulfodismutans TaxID=63561 RepID=A0A7K3NRN9_9BACT|nr:DUF448 domain-containing protein [Desulfolutivibrio sulfodismutans]NDY58858.1 DUF448 domain-containing protein [Desulfolutivibrio sulfodismutans]QLA14318.1 DUF448 domain-containing protein [Desulfolutivibrio sulfodismutans DSM 3696]